MKRTIAILLPFVLLGSMVVSARAAEVDSSTNDQFQQIVVQDIHSLDVTFTNDDERPWSYVSSGIQSPSMQKGQTSTLGVSFASERKIEVLFSWASHYSSTASYNRLTYYIDGAVQSYITGSTSESIHIFLEPGSHVITFKDSVNYTNSSNYGRLTSIKIREIVPLESYVVAEGSQPISIINNGDYPWTIENGYIQNGNYGETGKVSAFSATFTIDKPSMLSFEVIATGNSDSSVKTHELSLYGHAQENTDTWTYQTTWSKSTYIMPAGTYTIEFKDSAKTSTKYYSRIRTLSLTDEWSEVELAFAGTLGSEVLNIFEKLTDAELLKVKGTLNSTDWSTIAQMTQLKGLDLSEAIFTELPSNAFSTLKQLSYVTLPEGVTSIGQYAFQNTQVVQLQLPASVKTIVDHAFYQASRLCEVIIPSDSQIESIGSYAFSGCSKLQYFLMPNTITSVGTYAFNNCISLGEIVLSDALTALPSYMCYGCYKLSTIHLPHDLKTIEANCFCCTSANRNTKLTSLYLPESLLTINEKAFAYYSKLDSIILPQKLSTLGSKAFDYCIGTRYIQLPSYISGYNYTFEYCSSLEKVVCPSATPPTITNDPFASGKSKSNVTLEVPSFAMTTYKLNSYWNKFGNIVEGEEQDFWRVSNTLVLSDTSRMSGSPSITLTTSGRLTMIGSAPFNINTFSFNCSSTSTSALVNANPQLTADRVTSSYYINEANKWYFVTPPYKTKLTAITHGEGSQFIFRYYDAALRAANGTGSSWQNVTDTALYIGQGYILQSNGTGWLNFRDNLQAGQQMFEYNDVTLPLEAHESSKPANENWNFIGNPYPCYFDIWYLDFYTPITVWTGSTYKAYSIQDDNYALRPMQAFFVQKPSTVESITFRKEGRQVTSSISHGSSAPARKQGNSERRLINLSIGGEYEMPADETRVVINPMASAGYEMTCDASKFMSMEQDVPQIFSLDEDGIRMSINERPIGDGIIPIGCYIGSAGNYTITCAETDEVFLQDKQSGKTHDFADGGYTFTADESGYLSNRFYLEVRPLHNMPTAIQEQSAGPTVLSFASGLAIDCTAADAVVYTIDGRIVAYCEAGKGWRRLFLPSGMYVVRSAGQAVKQMVE